MDIPKIIWGHRLVQAVLYLRANLKFERGVNIFVGTDFLLTIVIDVHDNRHRLNALLETRDLKEGKILYLNEMIS